MVSMKGLPKKEKKVLRSIIVSAAPLLILKLLPELPFPVWPLYLVPYLIIGYDVLRKAVLGIVHGQVFDENFLMALATVGAYGTGDYAEAVFVMLFYQTGELFQDVAVNRSRTSISQLMDLRPDTAFVERDGETEEVDVEDVAVGETIVVKPGQRVPLDGTVTEGSSSLDTAALTGESVPRDVNPGDEILSGCVNQTGLLRIQVTKPSEESTVSRILELVENAGERKAKSEAFITRFAHYYTPSVVIAALALFLIPSLILWFSPVLPGFLVGTTWDDWFHRALIFLVISCPCALVISVPLSFFGGIGGASKCGILVKGGNHLEDLAKVETVVFDKTGTLTQGSFAVRELRPAEGVTEEELLSTAALTEQFSDHPIAQSLRRAWQGQLDESRLSQVEEAAGHGVKAKLDGIPVAVGNRRLMEELGLTVPDTSDLPGTVIFAAKDGRYLGCVLIADQVKPDAKAAIASLRRSGVKRTVMLTGDAEAAAKAVATELGLDEYHAGLLPDQKVDRVEEILANKGDGLVAFVGDGINDAPVLCRCDVGVAMGALGSDAAIEAADVVLMDDQPSKIALAMAVARKTIRIVHENIVFALAVKAIVLILGALGKSPMWLAIFADVGVAFLAILNAMRCLNVKELEK